jgi:hypothetical protein
VRVASDNLDGAKLIESRFGDGRLHDEKIIASMRSYCGWSCALRTDIGNIGGRPNDEAATVGSYRGVGD